MSVNNYWSSIMMSKSISCEKRRCAFKAIQFIKSSFLPISLVSLEMHLPCVYLRCRPDPSKLVEYRLTPLDSACLLLGLTHGYIFGAVDCKNKKMALVVISISWLLEKWLFLKESYWLMLSISREC